MKLRILLFIALLLASTHVDAQSDTIVRALYIDHFFEADSSEIILGDSLAEQQLFDYAENCGYNYLILYGLSAVPFGNNPDAVNALRSFVRRAHMNYEIKLGCVGQSSKFFNRIHQKYQSLEIVDSVERLDFYNLEFEFWKSYHSSAYTGYYCDNYLEPNGYSCDSIGAFEFAMDELVKIDSLASLLSDTALFSHPSEIGTEIYVGWINEYHAEILVDLYSEKKLDRILGAVYKPALADGSLNLYHFYHQKRRLGFLGNSAKQVDFLPIFAVKESQGNHLGDWMDTIGNLPLVWEHYQSAFENDTAKYTEQIHLNGYVWYNYSHMPLCFDSLEGSGWLTGPNEELLKDSIYTFEITNTINANRFYWELPLGVSWTDSLKWNNEAILRFSKDFNEGDNISVRAANRCHLGEWQYFAVNEFDGVKDVSSQIDHLFYSKGSLYLQLAKTKHTPTLFYIYNLSGQMVYKGKIATNLSEIIIPFNEKKAAYILSLDASENIESLIFIN